MRFLALWRTMAAAVGLLMATASIAPAQADSLNLCIDRCFNTFNPPSDCPTCTGERDRCVEECSKHAYSYGAIAYGPRSGAWGTSYRWQTKAKAESEAMAKCSEHGSDCEVMVWFEHLCGAVATGRDGKVSWGLGDGEGLARKNALDKCAQAGGKACKVQVSQCSR